MVLLTALYGGPQAPTTVVTTTQTQAIVAPFNLENYTRQYYKDTPILAEISKCESKFTQFDKDGNVVRGRINHADVGLMQINEYYHLDEAKKAGLDIYTIDGNLAYGKVIYDKYGTSPWSASEACWGKYATNKDLARK